MTVEALKAEMAGYLMRGLDDRANEVAAEIRRLGSDVETTAADTPPDTTKNSPLDVPEESPEANPLDADSGLPEEVPAKAKPAPRKRIR